MPAKTSPSTQRLPERTAARADTRERILAYLEENRVATAQVLSRTWRLTRANIRYHLNELLADGVIELVPRDPNLPARRGRPDLLYRLAPGRVPDNLLALSSALLDAVLCSLPVEDRETALQGLAARLAGSFVSVANLPQRLNQVSAYLSQHGYLARWEAHARGPRILLRSCPYAALLPTHPELCTLDRFLLERLVQLPLKQTAQINLAGGKPPACIFASGMES